VWYLASRRAIGGTHPPISARSPPRVISPQNGQPMAAIGRVWYCVGYLGDAAQPLAPTEQLSVPAPRGNSPPMSSNTAGEPCAHPTAWMWMAPSAVTWPSLRGVLTSPQPPAGRKTKRSSRPNPWRTHVSTRRRAPHQSCGDDLLTADASTTTIYTQAAPAKWSERAPVSEPPLRHRNRPRWFGHRQP
jgi:hypothetical protein